MAEDITDCTPEARAGWNLAVRTAVAILKFESRSNTRSKGAREGFRMAATRIQSMLDDDCDTG